MASNEDGGYFGLFSDDWLWRLWQQGRLGRHQHRRRHHGRRNDERDRQHYRPISYHSGDKKKQLSKKRLVDAIRQTAVNKLLVDCLAQLGRASPNCFKGVIYLYRPSKITWSCFAMHIFCFQIHCNWILNKWSLSSQRVTLHNEKTPTGIKYYEFSWNSAVPVYRPGYEWYHTQLTMKTWLCYNNESRTWPYP